MKKATLSIGLFTLVMVLTSFTAPETSSSNNSVTTSIDGSGSQSSGGNRKVDYNGNTSNLSKTNLIVDIDGSGSQSSGGNRKVD